MAVTSIKPLVRASDSFTVSWLFPLLQMAMDQTNGTQNLTSCGRKNWQALWSQRFTFLTHCQISCCSHHKGSLKLFLQSFFNRQKKRSRRQLLLALVAHSSVQLFWTTLTDHTRHELRVGHLISWAHFRWGRPELLPEAFRDRKSSKMSESWTSSFPAWIILGPRLGSRVFSKIHSSGFWVWPRKTSSRLPEYCSWGSRHRRHSAQRAVAWVGWKDLNLQPAEAKVLRIFLFTPSWVKETGSVSVFEGFGHISLVKSPCSSRWTARKDLAPNRRGGRDVTFPGSKGRRSVRLEQPSNVPQDQKELNTHCDMQAMKIQQDLPQSNEVFKKLTSKNDLKKNKNEEPRNMTAHHKHPLTTPKNKMRTKMKP